MCRILTNPPGFAAAVFLILTLTACDRRIYVRDGVTDGDRFSLPFLIETDNNPVTGSWIAYSLDRSFCQLEHGGDNPARYSSFDCELSARDALVTRWSEIGGVAVDEASDADAAYLDALTRVNNAGFLPEYTWHYLKRRNWRRPDTLRLDAFDGWRRDALSRHKAQTKIIGSWGFVPTEDAL
ncbi:MAG: hypothetical protein AAF004_04450 [Pseudomonadota bacterium]